MPEMIDSCSNSNDNSFQDLMKIEGMVIDTTTSTSNNANKNELDVTQSTLATLNSSCSSLQMGNNSIGSLGGGWMSPIKASNTNISSSPRKLSPRPPHLKVGLSKSKQLSPKKDVLASLDRAIASPSKSTTATAIATKPPKVPKKNLSTGASPTKKTKKPSPQATKKVKNKLTSAPSSGTTRPQFKSTPSKSMSTPSKPSSSSSSITSTSSTCSKPKMDLRAILKKHESQRKAPVYRNAMGDEVQFFGSMNSIPFLKSPQAQQPKKKKTDTKKKKKKSAHPLDSQSSSNKNKPTWIYGEFDEDDDDEWTCYSSRTLNTTTTTSSAS